MATSKMANNVIIKKTGILILIFITIIACQANPELLQPKDTPTPAFTPTPTLIPTITPDPTIVACTAESQEFFTESKKILLEWSDGIELASSTSRVSLSGPISDLQRIRRDWKGLFTPSCLITAKDKMTGSMDEIIQGFLSFMSQDPDSVVNSHFDNAKTLQGDYTYLIDKFKAQINP